MRRTSLILGALMLALSVSSVSAAETTLLRWTHPSPSEVTGFRVFIGYSSRNYEPHLEMEFEGLTAVGGVYQAIINIDPTRPVYVALQAYGDEKTSAYSNERVFTVPLGVPGRPRLAD